MCIFSAKSCSTVTRLAGSALPPSLSAPVVVLSGGTEADVTGETLRPEDDCFSIRQLEQLFVKEANCSYV